MVLEKTGNQHHEIIQGANFPRKSENQMKAPQKRNESENQSSSPFDVVRVKLTTFIYPTEEPTLVEKALWNILPSKLSKIKKGDLQNPIIKRENLKLIDRTPLIRIQLDLDTPQDCRGFPKHLAKHFDSWEKRRVIDQIPTSLSQDGILYLRLDKQEAVQGKIKLTQPSNLIEGIIDPKTEPGHAIQLMLTFRSRVKGDRRTSKKSRHPTPTQVSDVLISEGFTHD